MLDHVGFGVSDYARSKAFYEQALAPLGITLLMEPVAQAAGLRQGRQAVLLDRDARAGGRGRRCTSRSSSRTARPSTPSTRPRSRRAGPTTARPARARSTTRTTTARYVLDPDGNNIEAVCHKPA